MVKRSTEIEKLHKKNIDLRETSKSFYVATSTVKRGRLKESQQFYHN